MRNPGGKETAAGHPSRANSGVDHRLDEADRLAQAGRFAEALPLVGAMLAEQPGRPELLQRVAKYNIQRGVPAEAIPALRSLTEQFPDVAALHNSLGGAYGGCANREAAITSFFRACALAPNRADYWYNLARAHSSAGDAQAARLACDRAISLKPDPEAYVLRGDNRRILGELEGAQTDYREALRHRFDLLSAWSGLLSLKSVRFDEAELALLGSLHRQSSPGSSERAAWGFIYGQALEVASRHADAFRVLVEANALRARQLRWRPSELSDFVDTMVEGFSGAIDQASDPSLGREVIFLIGMPRSGSTLAEQILSAHPKIEGAGEIFDAHEVISRESARRGESLPAWAIKATGDDWARLGREYLGRTARFRSSKAMFTDKQLDNWRYVGALRAMLPSARFVYCRRDPVETCWSCFKHSFVGNDAAFTYDFGHLAAFNADMAKLMHFWGQRYRCWIHELLYEAFLVDPVEGTRTLLNHCRVAFDDACLRFDRSTRAVRTASAAQVRRPLTPSPTMSAYYGDLLDPLRSALREAGRVSADPGPTLMPQPSPAGRSSPIHWKPL
ncbi:MAG: tetratricopeptide repeat-containing sulfotransferase family protein [Dyella sp.]|uniref:tetratricopeptide repeat-containing sulfotransferase family protein n=1 Tax=Dyella sp. TaxID=1869338 RepID=UPI003F7E5B61